MARRRFLAQLATWPLAAILPGLAYESKQASRLKITMKSAWGSDDPTKAAFQAVVLMRRAVAEAVTPVGWPRVAELLAKVVELKIPIYACGTCARPGV